MDVRKRNCPEKIIFCVDLHTEMNSLDFARNQKKPLSRMDVVKSAIKSLVIAKQKINTDHEYGIIVLTDQAIWYQDPTEDVDTFMKALSTLEPQQEFNSFSMTSLFDIIREHFPKITSDSMSLSDPVYRVIFIYGRSSITPRFDNTSHTAILDSPQFFFDCCYLHSKPASNNCPQDVFDFITEVEGKNHIGYFFENSTSLRKFQPNFASLLAHPLQRPEQGALKMTLS
mmetsp:Transcript_27474/g.38752  ORF Transcript_27474/g.38752 Transcript_27474/m.38752 type:complete len:228 (+) Transcript_27474:60-743(+)